jgi:hypothetical protein
MRPDIVSGATFPDYHVPDENGAMHYLSELQGPDNLMVLHLSRGEHCPRERQMHRELLKFHEWAAVGFASCRSCPTISTKRTS